MACQPARRASRGCEETGVGVDEPVGADDDEEEDREERLARRVSWMPGAEGAPRAEGTEVLAVRFVVVVGCADSGMMRRDLDGRRRC